MRRSRSRLARRGGTVARVRARFVGPEEADEEIRKHYLKLPISRAQLDALKTLRWGGGMEIQHAIWQEWDGEDELFDLDDLTGIEVLENLEEISIVSATTARGLYDKMFPARSLNTLSCFHVNVGWTLTASARLCELAGPSCRANGERSC